jgi:hypothetical protein
MPSKKLNTKGTPAQDLQAAREELKQFRRDVAILKKKGLLSKEYDARSVKPTRYLKGVLKEFSDVLSGKATPVKVSKQNQKKYKAQGRRIKNGRVIVPHSPNHKVIGTRGDFVVKEITPKETGVAGWTKQGHIHILDLGLSRDNILQWQQDLRNNKFKLQPGEVLRFKMFGYNSYMGFADGPKGTAQEQMAEYMEHYDMIEGALNGEIPPEKQGEYIDGVVIMKIGPDADGNYPMPRPNPDEYHYNVERREAALKRRAERERRYAERQGVVRREEYLIGRAEQRKEDRANMTPEKKEEYKRKARERARIAYEKAKAKRQ